ncbi:hypothetical protein [Mucilaginibacter pedocola]|uniref:DUF3313 domain-containing protein n=1 Tax=Mucilaginibacter pedocola TaxID=1792845 RepID=A0A1S9PI06_9SPHI|nr:hypothetical protein [Mucilaginibacter pedocola]OOQ60567.1 hypothetical protein BC343_25095 [Mucilaginibacter pedocola]
MKKILTLITLIAALASSCSHEVYNNKGYLAAHNIVGKTVAILPVEVYYAGKQPKNTDWYTQEQATSLNLQAQLEQAYLLHKERNQPKKHQYKVELMNTNTVNARLRNKMVDLRTAWTMAPDSVGRIIGADLVFKVRMSRERYMDENLAKGINAGAFVLEGLLNSNKKNKDVVLLPRVTAEDIGYEVSLIDAHTGEIVSRYVGDPNSENSKSINGINKAMASRSVVFAAK